MDGALQEPTWEAVSGDMLSGMREWRLQHPTATLREIETALDEHWYRLRARRLHDLAQKLPSYAGLGGAWGVVAGSAAKV